MESNADVYASFGVQSDIVAGTEEYDNAMIKIAQGTSVRDGDDTFSVEAEEDTVDNEEVQTEDTVEEDTAEEQVKEEEVLPELQAESNIEETSKSLLENQTGFEDLVQNALNTGKINEVELGGIIAEYEQEGKLSEGSYSKLAEAGYSKSFVQQYIRGQEALAKEYVNDLHSLVGGRENFEKYTEYLETHSPSTFEALSKAVENCDVHTIKGIMDMTRNAINQRFGKQQQRTVTNKTIQKPAHSKPAEVFGSREEMMKAISDPRYSKDAAYRKQVEVKIYNSKFF